LKNRRSKKLTIIVEAKVYNGQHTVIGRRRISRCLNDLACPNVVCRDLSAGYLQWQATRRANEAEAWTGALLAAFTDEPKRDH
jgi:hypothetical protein